METSGIIDHRSSTQMSKRGTDVFLLVQEKSTAPRFVLQANETKKEIKKRKKRIGANEKKKKRKKKRKKERG
jgi:hypothetical protein